MALHLNIRAAAAHLTEPVNGPCMVLTRPMTWKISRRRIRHCLRVDTNYLQGIGQTSCPTLFFPGRSKHTFRRCTFSETAIRGAISVECIGVYAVRLPDSRQLGSCSTVGYQNEEKALIRENYFLRRLEINLVKSSKKETLHCLLRRKLPANQRPHIFDFTYHVMASNRISQLLARNERRRATKA